MASGSVFWTINLANPSGYGRIIRDGFGNIQAIVEDKDATPEQLAINEVNTGIMAIPGNKVRGWVNGLKNENVQHEFYLTDIVLDGRGGRYPGYSCSTSDPY